MKVKTAAPGGELTRRFGKHAAAYYPVGFVVVEEMGLYPFFQQRKFNLGSMSSRWGGNGRYGMCLLLLMKHLLLLRRKKMGIRQ
jgi:hypothetical protein